MRVITALGVASLGLGAMFAPVAASADPLPWAPPGHHPGYDNDAKHFEPGRGHDKDDFLHVLPDII